MYSLFCAELTYIEIFPWLLFFFEIASQNVLKGFVKIEKIFQSRKKILKFEYCIIFNVF